MKSDCGVSRWHRRKQGDDSPKWTACSKPSSRHSSAFKFITCLSKCASVCVWTRMQPIVMQVLRVFCTAKPHEQHPCVPSALYLYIRARVSVRVTVIYGWGSANRWDSCVNGCALTCTHARMHTSQGVSLQIGFSPLGWQSWQALYERNKQGSFITPLSPRPPPQNSLSIVST